MSHMGRFYISKYQFVKYHRKVELLISMMKIESVKSDNELHRTLYVADCPALFHESEPGVAIPPLYRIILDEKQAIGAERIVDVDLGEPASPPENPAPKQKPRKRKVVDASP
jgi:hypothetical protein